MSTGTMFLTDYPRVQVDNLYARDTSDSERAFAGHDDLSYRLVIGPAFAGLMDHLSPPFAAQIKSVSGRQEFDASRYDYLGGMITAGKQTDLNTEMAEYAVVSDLLSETVHQPHFAFSGSHTVYWVSGTADLPDYMWTGLERTGGVIHVDASGKWWVAPVELGHRIASSGTVVQPADDIFAELSDAYAAPAEYVGVQHWLVSNTQTAPHVHISDAEEAYQWHSIAREFSFGANGEVPERDIIAKVDRMIKAVISGTEDAEYSVDEDGALSFEATLSSGLFIMCEVSLAGNINAGLYYGPDGDLDRFLTRPTEEELLGLF